MIDVSALEAVRVAGSDGATRNTQKAVLFPYCTTHCEECGDRITNDSMEYQTVGYFHDVSDTEARWFCSMRCVLAHKQKEKGLELLKDLNR